jgi:hypothetical protein
MSDGAARTHHVNEKGPPPMPTDVKLRISLATGEFELQGPEAFVAQYDEFTRPLLERLASSNPQAFTSAANSADVVQSTTANGAEQWPEFGEAIHRLPRGASGTDQILLAGFYASLMHSERTFATAEASKLLVEQGIKVSNPSQSLKNNMDGKKVFRVGNRFKISREGQDRVNALLGRP